MKKILFLSLLSFFVSLQAFSTEETGGGYESADDKGTNKRKKCPPSDQRVKKLRYDTDNEVPITYRIHRDSEGRKNPTLEYYLPLETNLLTGLALEPIQVDTVNIYLGVLEKIIEDPTPEIPSIPLLDKCQTKDPKTLYKITEVHFNVRFYKNLESFFTRY